MFTGPWAKWFTRVQTDPSIALIVDTCDPETGEILQVIAHGNVASAKIIIDRETGRSRGFVLGARDGA